MTTISASAHLRARPDLTFNRVSFGSRTYWIAKDPLALRYYRLDDEAYFILSQFNGQRGFDALRIEFERRFAPRRVRSEELFRYATRLHEQGLLVSTARGQGPLLAARGRTQSVRDLLGRFANPFAIRCRGIDAQLLIERTYPWIRPLFRPWAIATAALLLVVASGLVVVQFQQFLRMLPSHDQFFSPAIILWMLAAIGAVKVAHELGHALTCRHFGGTCHELGFMLLFFSPCLYCNVTDAWRFPDKRHRIGVAAAGIVVELVMAAIATLFWWFSSPGVVHHLSFTIMVVCSMNTLLLNGNPLLKYDGYYVLADLLEMPDLAERSAEKFYEFCRRLFLGRQRTTENRLADCGTIWLLAYFLISKLYRLLLISALLLLLIHRADDHQVGSFLRGCVVIAAGVSAAKYLQRARRLAVNSSTFDLPLLRVVCLITTMMGIASWILFIPMPKYVWGTAEIRLVDPQQVVVDIPGRLVESLVRPGQRVSDGMPLAKLRNDDLELEYANLAASLERYRYQLALRHRERFDRSAAALHIGDLEELVQSLERQLNVKRADLASLTLTANREGVVFGVQRELSMTDRADELRSREGCPLDAINLGCSVARGTHLCEIGDPTQWQAFILIDQNDVPQVQLNQAVEIAIAGFSGRRIIGRVCEVSGRDVKQIAPQLSGKYAGDVPTLTQANGAEGPQLASHYVRVQIAGANEDLCRGLIGTGKIAVASEPLAKRAARWFRRMFLAQL